MTQLQPLISLSVTHSPHSHGDSALSTILGLIHGMDQVGDGDGITLHGFTLGTTPGMDQVGHGITIIGMTHGAILGITQDTTGDGTTRDLVT